VNEVGSKDDTDVIIVGDNVGMAAFEVEGTSCVGGTVGCDVGASDLIEGAEDGLYEVGLAVGSTSEVDIVNDVGSKDDVIIVGSNVGMTVGSDVGASDWIEGAEDGASDVGLTVGSIVGVTVSVDVEGESDGLCETETKRLHTLFLSESVIFLSASSSLFSHS